jgi:hypothetical protein
MMEVLLFGAVACMTALILSAWLMTCNHKTDCGKNLPALLIPEVSIKGCHYKNTWISKPAYCHTPTCKNR